MADRGPVPDSDHERCASLSLTEKDQLRFPNLNSDPGSFTAMVNDREYFDRLRLENSQKMLKHILDGAGAAELHDSVIDLLCHFVPPHHGFAQQHDQTGSPGFSYVL